MLESSRFMLPEDRKGVSFIILSPSSTVLAPWGSLMNVR